MLLQLIDVFRAVALVHVFENLGYHQWKFHVTADFSPFHDPIQWNKMVISLID